MPAAVSKALGMKNRLSSSSRADCAFFCLFFQPEPPPAVFEKVSQSVSMETLHNILETFSLEGVHFLKVEFG